MSRQLERATRVRLDLAVAVAALRAAGEPWKVICRQLGRSRCVLAELEPWGARVLAVANDVRAEPGREGPNLSGRHLQGCIAGNSGQSVEAPPGDAEPTPMGAIFPKPKLPPVQSAAAATPAAPEPSRDDPAVEEARKKALIVTATERGRASTRLTSPLGATGGSNTLRQTLGGS